ncbi:SMYD3 [Symbiodinium sp. CCMP2592]|nr:SMYD3 [Symbiodinium sp. CCMP2592]
MADLEDLVYCQLISESGNVPICGWVVAKLSEDLVIATAGAAVESLEQKLVVSVGDVQVGIIRLPGSAASLSVPTRWKGLRPAALPTLSVSQAAWKKTKDAPPESSDTSAAEAAPRRKKGLEADLAGLTALFGGKDGAATDDEDDDEEDSEEELLLTKGPKHRYLPPGGASSGDLVKKEKKKKKDDGPALMRNLLKQGMEKGQTANDLMPMMMMAMMLDRDRGERKKRRSKASGSLDPLGGLDSESSSDDDLGKRKDGMKAIASLQKMHRRIMEKPGKICEEFEREVIEELGVVKGQAWTLKDFLRKQSWGKFKGIYRCAWMDVAVYELLRANRPDAAAAQVIQNLKAKQQSVIQMGDWQAAWLLTGLADPLARREFAGSKQEMSVVSSYLSALHDLKKKVREAHQTGHGEAEEEEQGMLLERSSSQDAPLFPSMLPYPEVILPEGVHLEAEPAKKWFAKTFVNTWVCWGNFVALGCPSMRGACIEPRVAYYNMADARVFADRLLGEVEEFTTLDLALGNLSCEGKRGTIESMLERVRCTAGACYSALVGQVAAQEVAGALPVVAARVAIPKEAGTVDPCKWLPPDRVEIFRQLHELRKPEFAWSDVVVACHRVPACEEAALAEHLLQSKMAVLVPEEQLPRDKAGRLMCGGLFSVPKNELEDRLIFDRRPENATMERLRWAQLPNGACFTRMLLKPNQYLRGSGQDLRNYYYSLMLPDGWLRFNSVGRRVSREVVRRHGGDPRIAYRLCFRVLGMGDVNGCCIAQAVHEEVLRRRGVLRDDNILVYGKPVPEQDLWTGAYLDDLLVALRCTVPEPVPLDGTFVPPEPQESDEDVRAIRAAIAGYEEAGLQRAVHKEFNQIVDFKAWGAEVKGVKGTVGAPMEVRQQLWALLAKVVSLGWCTREVLQRIVGYVSFVFQFRREMYSLQHHIYKFMANLPKLKWRRIPGHVLDELRSFALHLPFAYFSMRKRLDLEVLATDATPTSGGAVTALVSEALADELWRRSEVRGEPVRLDRSEGFLSSIAPPAAPSQFASAVAESLPWSVISSYSFRQTSHINLQELRALRREIVRLASRSSGEGLIKLCLNDSRVVIGAVTKGRSSSYKLNGLLRTMLPYLTAANITLALLWVETESNRADAPSRFESLPAPVPAPPWLQSFGVDAWRAGAGLEVFSRAGRMTEAHRALGLPMLEPIDFTLGCDVFDSDIEARLRRREVAWLWLAPPSKGFNRRWCAQAGPAIRPKGEPEGDEADPRTWWGNLLWRHSLYLAQVALDHGVFVFLEHPRKSLAWALRDTELFQHRAGMIKHRVDWCMYGEHGHDLSVGNAQSVVLSNAPWLGSVIRRCAQKHVHPIPVRGSSAKRCDHPWGFCVELANAYRAWLLSMALALGAPLRRSSSPGLVDRWLERCVDHAYRTGEKLYRVRLGVLGVQRILNIAGPLLRSTWSALRGWRALQPVRSRVPISSSLLHAFLVVSLARGNAEVGRARERWWSAMLAAWLSFEGLLRPGELCQLRAGDIDLPLDSLTAADEGLILTIRQPKTRRVYHTQFVLVKEPRLVKWMVWWLDAVPSGRKLFRLGRREWARLLTAGLSALGADQKGYTLGSLRGGGATAHFRAHENLARLQYHGRWASFSSARIMGERLQRALRELADALQEAEQEEQQKESRASQPGRGSTSSRATSPAPSLAGSSSSWSRVGGAKARAAATERDPLRRVQPPAAQPLEHVPASAVVRNSSVNCYVVLENPLQPTRVGWIMTTWKTLEASLPSGRLCTSHVRLRRVDSVEAAMDLWNSVHPNHPCPQLKL